MTPQYQSNIQNTENDNNVPDMKDSYSDGTSTSMNSNMEVSFVDYSFPHECGGFKIDVAVGSYERKGEDKFAVVTSMKDPELAECQSKSTLPTLVAYFGVFDGHDGGTASEYCSKGLLQHVISETLECDRVSQKDASANGGKNSDSKDIFERGFTEGYQRAEFRLAANSTPPTFDEVKRGVLRTRTNKGFVQRYCCVPQKQVRGGTTACTLGLFSQEETSPIHEAIIANCGDCRCITDDGTGTNEFRQITTDHRPSEESENRRLKPYVRRKEAILENDPDSGVLRVHPGGLSVSRSIGDVALSSAVISTPDVFHVPLHLSSEETKRKTQRFVIACDGLWDVMDNEQVGNCAACQSSLNGSTKVNVGPRQAAQNILEECLKNKGYEDDVTIMIVDVSLTNEYML